MTKAELIAEGKSPKSMRYIDTNTGQSVPRRTVLNDQAKAIGFKDYKQFTDLANSKGYRRALIRASRETNTPVKQLRSLTNPQGITFGNAYTKAINGTKQEKIEFFRDYFDWDVTDRDEDFLDAILEGGDS